MKEHNKNKNQTHLIVNEVLKTSADVICLEKLNDIKRKKNKYQNKRSIGQASVNTPNGYKSLEQSSTVQTQSVLT